MKRYDIQVILVSDQVIPNITPVLDKMIQPRKVILCSSGRMRTKAHSMAQFFISKNIETKIHSIGSAYDFNELQDNFMELAARLEGESAAINLTGGTKLMTIAAQSTFGADFDCFYVIPGRDQIVMIQAGDKTVYEIEDAINLKDYFAVHGYSIESMKERLNISGKSRALFKNILDHYHEIKNGLSTLNYLAAEGEPKRELSVQQAKNPITIHKSISDKAMPIIAHFYEHGAVSYYDDSKIIFADESSRKFCQGFWLEDYTYLALAQLHKEIGLQDFACSVELMSPTGTKNEIDAAFLYNNTLYIVECKTAKMGDKGTDALYKIDTIRDYGGLLTKSIFITMGPLSEHDSQRAKDLRVECIQAEQISTLSDRLKKIITGE